MAPTSRTFHLLRRPVKKLPYNFTLKSNRFFTMIASDNKLAQSYKELEIPPDSKQEVVRKAFLELAKKYHPDSGSPEADIDKFCDIENAFRTLSKHNIGMSNKEEVEQIVYNIRHTAPQHRQYLSFDGVGHGTPSQRMRQWTQVRAQKAVENVMEHRMSKAVASEHALMKKGEYSKKHNIKTKYGFDRLVEDLIQEAISKGEFQNLTGSGKPLRDQNRNPYVDFTTHKLNEVLINNGFTPEWITMNRDIEHDIQLFKNDIEESRLQLGPYPLSEEDKEKWNKICDLNKDIAKSINSKINTFNLIVPLMNKQKFHIDFEKICDDIIRNSKSNKDVPKKVIEKTNSQYVPLPDQTDSVMTVFFKALGDMFTDLTKGVTADDSKKSSGR